MTQRETPPVGSKASAVTGLGKQCENLSIMMPYFNGKKTIAETLDALKIQQDDIAGAEIVLLDDVSTDGSAEYVQSLWPERVTYRRNEKNIGLIQGFNNALAKATRPFVYILHQDDVPLPGAFREFDACVRLGQELGIGPLAVYSRTIHADENLIWQIVNDGLGKEKRGRLFYDPADWRTCPVQFVSILLAKEVLTELNGFEVGLYYAADWDLWWRLGRTERCIYSNVVTGAYRMSTYNTTSKLKKSGQAMKDELAYLKRVEESLKETGLGSLKSPAEVYAHKWYDNVDLLNRSRHDPEAYDNNLDVLATFPDYAIDRKQLFRFRLSQWKRRLLGGAKGAPKP